MKFRFIKRMKNKTLLWLLCLINLENVVKSFAAFSSLMRPIEKLIQTSSFTITDLETLRIPHITNVDTKPMNLYFTGAGIYFWWQIGAAKYIRENCDLTDVMIQGASAGSITATMLLSGCDFEETLNIALELADKHDIYRSKSGLKLVLGGILSEFLDKVIPEEIDEKILRPLQIALTPAEYNIPKYPFLIAAPSIRKQLIECIKASCHIPVLLDGRVSTTYKDMTVVDGSFWYFVTKNRWTGLPIPQEGPSSIYWVDYSDDEEFMKKISGNILELADPKALREMISSGFNHMSKQDRAGTLPFKRKETSDDSIQSNHIPNVSSVVDRAIDSRQVLAGC